ncbi:MAG TPA: FkbM family methyltransferase [Kofleriaceae bacterium]|nr:FkbM family methyltransferase [Kofleriaceae bacterium]
MRLAAKNEKQGILTMLHQSRLFHDAVRVFRVQRIAKSVLTRIPLSRTLHESKLRYRLRNLESFLLADEIFKGKVYRDAFDGADVQTFVDLGCNVGFFVLYAAAQSKLGREVIGLAVDGSEEMADETRWHVEQNGLTNVRVELGAAGFPPDVHETTFYVNPSNVASSAQPTLNPNVPKKGDSVAVKVPVVHVHERWRSLHGDRRIDLLKIDVEGTECDLIRNEPALLAIADRIVIEWHKWITSLDEVGGLLRAAGFSQRVVVGEDDNAGVAVFERTRPAARAT